MTATGPRESPAWRAVPATRPRGALSPFPVALAAAVPTAVQAARLDGWPGVLIALVGAGAVGLLPVPTPAALAAATTAVALATVVGPLEGVVLVAAMCLWRLAGGATVTGRSVRPVGHLGPVVVASILLILRDGVAWPAVFITIGFAERALAARRPDGTLPLTDLLERAAARVGRVIGALAMVPACLVVAWGWAARRIVGLDPLAAHLAGPANGWHERVAADRTRDRLYGGDPVRTRPPLRRRLRLRLGNVVLVAAVALLASVVWFRSPGAPPSAAFADDPNFAQQWTDQQGFMRHPRFDPNAIYRFADYHSSTINQTDGIRRSWTAPPCSCRRLKVWWFGGSAAWGFYQSDEETPPSQLAKAAWEQNVVLDIENRAAPGYTLSQEVQKFAALTTTEPAPDLVIFYDGANEIDFQIERNNEGRGSDESPVAYSDDLLETMYSGLEVVVGLGPNPATGSVVADDADDAQLDAPVVATHSVNRYRRGVELARRLAASIGTTGVFVWQPTQTTAPPEVYAPFEPSTPWKAPDLEWFDRLLTTARAQLPDEVIDLSDVFDDETGPIMPDWAHTNPEGSRLVGAALADELLGRGLIAAP